VLGHGANKLSPQKVKMAMALTGKNRHYRWEEILPRHFIEIGRQCGLAEDVPILIQALIEATPAIIRKVESRIPIGFPASVSEPILTGLADAAKKLDNTPASAKRFRPK
jgi:serine/threonine-protein kinase HipA